MNIDYREFGFEVLRYIDRKFLYEAGWWSVKIYNLLKTRRKPPLDWSGNNWPKYYNKQNDLLWIIGKDGERLYIPQSVIISPIDAFLLHNKLKVSLIQKNFIPPYKNEECLSYYLKSNSFNELNARLASYDSNNKKLIFQGCHYFDWIATNLSMDFDRSPLETLREESSINGMLQDLNRSPLGNITGINGLIFTNDGHMIYQKRNRTVLTRPNQLCSGFSGTVDKIDIENIIKIGNPVLSDMDFPREAVEEVGINRDHICETVFLGVTRELIRGGTPEFFYSLDLDLSRNEVMSLIPRDKEGTIKSVQFGKYAKSNISSCDVLNETTLWQLMDKIEKESRVPISIPLLTNLALWYWRYENQKVGIGYNDGC